MKPDQLQLGFLKVLYGSNMKLMRAAGSAMDEAAAPEISTSIEVGNITIYANVDATLFLK